MKWLLTAAIVALYILHQDFWLWEDKTLVLGVLPIGLAYHAGFSLAAAALMALLVKYAWPAQLENVQPEPGVTPSVGGH